MEGLSVLSLYEGASSRSSLQAAGQGLTAELSSLLAWYNPAILQQESKLLNFILAKTTSQGVPMD